MQREFINNTLEENKGDPAAVWKCLKRFWPSKSKKQITQLNDSTDPREIANTFNSFFSNIGQELAGNFDDDDTHYIWPKHAPTFDITLTDASTVARLIQSLSPSRSCGTDGITSKLIKDAGACIIHPLVFIFNSSIEQKCFPKAWKKATVTAIFKSGNKCSPNNYRPISILCTFSKLLERVIHEQLYAFLRQCGRLVESQSGFRKGYSTATCLIDFLAGIYQNVNRGVALVSSSWISRRLLTWSTTVF